MLGLEDGGRCEKVGGTGGVGLPRFNQASVRHFGGSVSRGAGKLD